MMTFIVFTELYCNDDGTVPATFQFLYFIGWKPDKSQTGPAKRGSATVSMTDLGELVSNRTVDKH